MFLRIATAGYLGDRLILLQLLLGSGCWVTGLLQMVAVTLRTRLSASICTALQALQVLQTLRSSNLGPRSVLVFLPWKPWPILKTPLIFLMSSCPRNSLGVTCKHNCTLQVPTRATNGCVPVLLRMARSTGALILRNLCCYKDL